MVVGAWARAGRLIRPTKRKQPHGREAVSRSEKGASQEPARCDFGVLDAAAPPRLRAFSAWARIEAIEVQRMATFVVFAGIDSAGRNELWKTEGTASGTSEITSGTGFGGGIFSNTSPGLL